jgi:hypothetical protein
MSHNVVEKYVCVTRKTRDLVAGKVVTAKFAPLGSVLSPALADSGRITRLSATRRMGWNQSLRRTTPLKRRSRQSEHPR